MNRHELDIIDSDDILGTLEDLFDDLSIESPTVEQLYQMYGIFLNDIVKNPIMIGGTELSYNRNISRHPVCRGKMQAFEHLITRESKYKGKRDFDRERANKIHWIRPIIVNASDARIKYFERLNDRGYNQLYYWYEERGFMVIVRELKPGLILITSFSVDALERPMYKRWYNLYKAK